MNADRIFKAALNLKNYAEYLPHNKPVQKSSEELYDMVDGLNNQYKGEKVSEVFCRIKMNNIEAAATTIQKMEGSKPR